MDVYDKVIRLIDVNIIYCLFPLTLSLLLIETGLKNRFKTKESLNFIRWIIIAYTLVTLTHYLYGLLFFPDEYAVMQRATGPYRIIFWLMTLCATVLPLSLFFKKLAEKPTYLLLVSALIKLGVLMEFYTLTIISFHRDYLPEVQNYDWWNSPLITILLFFLQGFLLALLLLGGFEFAEKMKLRNSSLE